MGHIQMVVKRKAQQNNAIILYGIYLKDTSSSYKYKYFMAFVDLGALTAHHCAFMNILSTPMQTQ